MKYKNLCLPSKFINSLLVLLIFMNISAVSLANPITGSQLVGTYGFGAGTVLTGPFVRIESLTYTGTTKPGPNDIHFTVKWTLNDTSDNTTWNEFSWYDFNITPNVDPGTTINDINISTYAFVPILWPTQGPSSPTDLGILNLYHEVLNVGADVVGTDVQAYWTRDGKKEPYSTPVPEPSTYLLSVLGLVGLWLAKRKREYGLKDKGPK